MTSTSTIERVWSPYQQNIFDFIKNGPKSSVSQGKRNAIIRAVAGSGKTTTIVEGMKQASGHNVFLAFNKSIADELKARGVNARTFHSLTYSPVMKHRRAFNVEADKLKKLTSANWTRSDCLIYGSFAMRLVGLARQMGIGCLMDDTPNNWMDIVVHHDLEIESELGELGRGIELATDLLALSNESSMVDFDDLLYFAVRDNILLPKFSFVFVDEAQDTNAIQRALLRKVLAHDSRLIAVGDPAQAIYGFRGADSESMALIAEEFDCVELPLTVSYRCPTSVIKYAQEIVPDIQAAPGAPEGKVTKLGKKWKLLDFKDGDLIICRTTRHLITLAFQLMKARIPAQVVGNDIGAGIKGMIKRMNALDIDDLQKKVESWRDREVAKAEAKEQDSKVERIYDMAYTINMLIDSMGEDNRTIETLLATITTLFAVNVQAPIKLATIHKAKGLEAPRVYWLNSSQCPPQWVRKAWQKKQEMNLCYVAITRAMEELILIEQGN